MRGRSSFVTALAAGSAALAIACARSFGSAGGPVDAADAATEGDTGPAESGQGDGGTDEGSTSADGEVGPDAVDRGVVCGTGPRCDPRTEVCCEHLPGGGIGCLPEAQSATCQGSTLACDDGADCAFVAGGVCCGRLGSNGTSVVQSNCFTLSNCKQTSFWAVVCDPSAPNACPGGVPCNVPDAGGFGFCQGLIHP